jgi:hypothetical protein
MHESAFGGQRCKAAAAFGGQTAARPRPDRGPDRGRTAVRDTAGRGPDRTAEDARGPVRTLAVRSGSPVLPGLLGSSRAPSFLAIHKPELE